MYWPRFQPLWSPDIGWNPTTLEWSFHLPPVTSIQLAVIPRNDDFVLSAVHPSEVDEIQPGASYIWRWVQLIWRKRALSLTRISFFSIFNHSTNSLWIYTSISCQLGRSFHVVLGLMATRQLQNMGFLVRVRAWLNNVSFQCTIPFLHTPGHCMQWTGQLCGLLHHACMFSPSVASLRSHQALAGPLPPPSCLLSFADIAAKEVCGDSQVFFHLYNVLYICHNADECVCDSSNSLWWKMPSSHHPLLPVCWPWWYMTWLACLLPH